MTQYTYTSTADIKVTVPANIHKMIQRGYKFDHVQGGKVNKQCVFVVFDGKEVSVAKKVDATIEAAKKNAVVKVAPAKKAKAKTKAKKAKGKKSNADLMREFVAAAKKAGKTLEDAIAYGINDLGQNKSQAKKYATDIWNSK